MYYEFLTSEVSCPKCGWSGTGDDIRCGELFREVFEYHCPSCGRKLGCCSLPTTDEARANWDIVSEEERKRIRKLEERRARFEKLCLQSAEQLPNVAAESIAIQWDFERVEEEHEEMWTVLRHEDQVLWREPAVWEGEERFREVVEVLREKYGRRLLRVTPTEASKMWLYGDHFSASDISWSNPSTPPPEHP